MAVVSRLVTLADIDGDARDRTRMSVSCRHEAELDDGRRLLLLDDRGWTSAAMSTGADAHGDVWAETTIADIEADCRTVVGPDEPLEGETQAEMEAGHWAWISRRLEGYGVVAEPEALRRLPHDVVLSDRLLARMGREGA